MVYDFSPVPGHEDVWGGFANMKVDGTVHDVLVLGTGLLLVAAPGQSGPGIPRLHQLLRSGPVADLVRRHRFIGYGDVVRAKIVKRTPIRVELELAGGRQVSLVAGWTTPLLTKQSDKALIELLTTRPTSSPSPQPGQPADPPVPPVGPPAAGTGRLYLDGCDVNAATVLDAVASILVNDIPYDLVILDVGLVLIADPDPGPAEQGRDRLNRLVSGVPAYAIAAWNWLVRYEEVTQARIIKNIPLRADLDLYDGRHLNLKEPWTTNVSNEARTTLAQALMSVGATAA